MNIDESILRTVRSRLKMTFPAMPNEDREDSLSEACLDFYETNKQEDFNTSAQIKAWLFKTSFRLLLKEKHRKILNFSLDKQDSKENKSPIFKELSYDIENDLDCCQMLEYIVDKLPISYHEFIENYYIQGYDSKLMAIVHRCSQGALRMRHQRALEKIREIISKKYF